jgi:hypothetical protein
MSSYEYNQLLKFLYFEGYADSYEEAECILEDMSDEEFEELCEKKLAHSFPLKPSEKRSVENIKRMNDGDFSVSPGGRSSTETRSASKPDPTPTTPTTSKPKRKSEFIDRSGVSDQGNRGSRRRIREEREDFDIISEFLFVEGYADTIESAELMAESISEEWVEEILDEKYVKAMDTTGRGADHRTRFPKFKGKDNEFDPKFTQQRVKSNTKKIDPYFSGRKERKDEKRQGTGGFGA